MHTGIEFKNGDGERGERRGEKQYSTFSDWGEKSEGGRWEVERNRFTCAASSNARVWFHYFHRRFFLNQSPGRTKQAHGRANRSSGDDGDDNRSR